MEVTVCRLIYIKLCLENPISNFLLTSSKKGMIYFADPRRERDRQGRGNHLMIRFKSCPKCQGDMIIEGEEGFKNLFYLRCIQCGHNLYSTSPEPYSGPRAAPWRMRGAQNGKSTSGGLRADLPIH